MPAYVGVPRPVMREPSYNRDQVPEVVVRDFKITKAHVLKHGPTTGCRGCKVVIEGMGAKGHHSPECRERMRKLLAESEEGVRKLEETEARLNRAVMQEPERIQPGIGASRSDSAEGPEEQGSKRRRIEAAPPNEPNRVMEDRTPGASVNRDPRLASRAQELRANAAEERSAYEAPAEVRTSDSDQAQITGGVDGDVQMDDEPEGVGENPGGQDMETEDQFPGGSVQRMARVKRRPDTFLARETVVGMRLKT